MNSFQEFSASVGGLLTAIGLFCGGIASLIAVLKRSSRKKNSSSGESREDAHLKSRHTVFPRLMTGLSIVTFAAGGVLVGFRLAAAPPPELPGNDPLSVRMTNAAWKALDAAEYATAIARAQDCITKFGSMADAIQTKLEKHNAPIPQEGPPANEKEKQAIFAQGVLNDVATSYHIMGKSYEGLKNVEEARKAYEHAARYTYALTWDPQGWFWSPSVTARAWLDSYSKTSP